MTSDVPSKSASEARAESWFNPPIVIPALLLLMVIAFWLSQNV